MTRLLATNATAEAVSIRRHHCQDSLVGMRREARLVTRERGDTVAAIRPRRTPVTGFSFRERTAAFSRSQPKDSAMRKDDDAILLQGFVLRLFLRGTHD
jgi:hypothetical protein